MPKPRVPKQRKPKKEKNTETAMDLWGHIGELRNRLVKAVVGLLLTTLISFSISEKIIEFLTQPVGGIQKIQAIEVTENISVFMRVSLLSGFIFAFPYIFYQLIAFIVPGMTGKERRWLIISIPFATLLFLSGVAFAYYVMLPSAIPFLTGFMNIPTLVRPSSYFDFILNIMFWIGISFEFPLVIYLLAKLKVVSAKFLATYWRIAIVIIALVAALITPTVDPINMAIFMAPLIVLYFLSIGLAYFARRGEKYAAEPA
jgi:sec-independent protein translocase protein TatC